MSKVREIIKSMPDSYKPAPMDGEKNFYFSIGDEKWTINMTAEGCTVTEGKAVDNADCVLKTTPEIFENLVLKGKAPGAMDIARGRFKTNDVAQLSELQTRFDLG